MLEERTHGPLDAPELGQQKHPAAVWSMSHSGSHFALVYPAFPLLVHEMSAKIPRHLSATRNATSWEMHRVYARNRWNQDQGLHHVNTWHLLY
jgi:hypothetical protein